MTRWIAIFAACLLLPGCSQAGAPAVVNETAGETGQPASSETPKPQARRGQAATAPAAPATRQPAQSGSRVLGEKDFTLRGNPACEIRFVYAGHEADTVFWEEPCEAVNASMMTQSDLESFDRWERLDEFARKFVNALPGGQVLYVEGSFSASVYPIGTTGLTYEVPVAD
ncbi:hypothetical protein [Allosphingosinicella deserti]|uniref:Uncharacterized protein n=1 Tax=Allosphingosinicella deserti TaxID=2116704 RepID=A0A2P7QLE9_9SPHN|nr:hypothetical protein [Sphingomonas deserti]PSJ38793.1 hypothetical protein C7I55_15805 [Sphingomonas deserti]